MKRRGFLAPLLGLLVAPVTAAREPEVSWSSGGMGSGSLFQNFGTEAVVELHGLETVMTPAQWEYLAANSWWAR